MSRGGGSRDRSVAQTRSSHGQAAQYRPGRTVSPTGC